MSKNLPEGFETPSKEIVKRHVISITGPDKSGKTHFSLTAPGPIAFFNLNTGLEGVIHKFDTKEIYEFRMNAPEEQGAAGRTDEAKRANAKAAIDMKNLAQLEVERFVKGWQWALSCPPEEVKTIVIDKCTELWLLYRVAEFGKTTQVPAQLYNYLNAKFERRINEIFGTEKNLILIHDMKEIYRDKNPTGEYERDGYKKIGGIVQTNLFAERSPEKLKHPIPGQPNPPFIIRVENSRINENLLNQDFVGPLANFPMIAATISGTSPTDWE
jgi:hypothetical protein